MIARSALAVAAAILLWPVSGVAQDEGGEGGGCSFCDEFQSGTTWYHQETWFGITEIKVQGGEYHMSPEWGSCGDWIEVFREHERYNNALALQSIELARGALADGADEAVLKVLQEDSSIRINQARNALQVVSADERFVIFHAPIEPEQIHRLVVALSAASASSQGNAAAAPISTSAEETRRTRSSPGTTPLFLLAGLLGGMTLRKGRAD